MANYYIAKNKQRFGPFPEEQLLQNGLTPNTLVWCKGMKKWTKAREVPELAPYVESWISQQEAQSQQSQQSQYGFDPNTQFQYNQNYYVGKVPRLSFEESISSCFHNFANFKGRARRSEFWWFTLFTFLLGLIPFIGNIASLVCLIPHLAVSTRRLHDTGRSGWWLVAACIGSVILMSTSFLLFFIFIISGPSSFTDIDDDALIDMMSNYASTSMPSLYLIILIALSFIIMILYIMLLLFYCTDSDKNENKYGPSPKYKYENLGY